MSSHIDDSVIDRIAGALSAEIVVTQDLRPIEQPHSVVLLPEGMTAMVLDHEHLRPHPAEKRGEFTVWRPGSFADYVARHASESTEVWVDDRAGTALAVLDGHAASEIVSEIAAGWGRHRATLKLRTTPSWDRVASALGRPLGQLELSEWLDVNRDLIVDPDADTLLSMIDNLTVTSAGRMSTIRRGPHATFVAFDEETKTTTGVAGVEPPAKFTAVVNPFEGVDYAARVEIRLSIAAKVGEPIRMTLTMPRHDEVISAATQAAVNGVVSALEALGNEVPIFYGKVDRHQPGRGQ